MLVRGHPLRCQLEPSWPRFHLEPMEPMHNMVSNGTLYRKLLEPSVSYIFVLKLIITSTWWPIIHLAYIEYRDYSQQLVLPNVLTINNLTDSFHLQKIQNFDLTKTRCVYQGFINKTHNYKKCTAFVSYKQKRLFLIKQGIENNACWHTVYFSHINYSFVATPTGRYSGTHLTWGAFWRPRVPNGTKFQICRIMFRMFVPYEISLLKTIQLVYYVTTRI